jgi:hypothetical protein
VLFRSSAPSKARRRMLVISGATCEMSLFRSSAPSKARRRLAVPVVPPTIALMFRSSAPSKARRRRRREIHTDRRRDVPILGAKQSPAPPFATSTFSPGRADYELIKEHSCARGPKSAGGSTAYFMSK